MNRWILCYVTLLYRRDLDFSAHFPQDRAQSSGRVKGWGDFLRRLSIRGTGRTEIVTFSVKRTRSPRDRFTLGKRKYAEMGTSLDF